MMRPLFPLETTSDDVPQIAGLSYLRQYISHREEQALVAAIDACAWDTSWDRRRQLYGGAYGNVRGAAAPPPIPHWGVGLADWLLRDGIADRPLDHLLINEYLPGQGIAMHVDYRPFDRTVVSLSLLSPCVMDFRHVDDERRESLLLEPRSLLVLSDDARYQWQHGIARRKNDRWQGIVLPRQRRLSVTFRSLRRR